MPGAVFFETIRRTISTSTSVLYFLAGNLSGIALIFSLVFLGLSALSLDGLSGKLFYALSGIAMVWIGLSAITESRKSKYKIASRTKLFNHNSRVNGFLVGVILAAVNPISIILWISIMGSFMSEMTSADAILNGLAVLAGAITLFLLLILIVFRTKTRFSGRFLLWLNLIFAAIIVIYGLTMLLNILG